jgi:hypothetical protein
MAGEKKKPLNQLPEMRKMRRASRPIGNYYSIMLMVIIDIIQIEEMQADFHSLGAVLPVLSHTPSAT